MFSTEPTIRRHGRPKGTGGRKHRKTPFLERPKLSGYRMKSVQGTSKSKAEVMPALSDSNSFQSDNHVTPVTTTSQPSTGGCDSSFSVTEQPTPRRRPGRPVGTTGKHRKFLERPKHCQRKTTVPMPVSVSYTPPFSCSTPCQPSKSNVPIVIGSFKVFQCDSDSSTMDLSCTQSTAGGESSIDLETSDTAEYCTLSPRELVFNDPCTLPSPDIADCAFSFEDLGVCPISHTPLPTSDQHSLLPPSSCGLGDTSSILGEINSPVPSDPCHTLSMSGQNNLPPLSTMPTHPGETLPTWGQHSSPLPLLPDPCDSLATSSQRNPPAPSPCDKCCVPCDPCHTSSPLLNSSSADLLGLLSEVVMVQLSYPECKPDPNSYGESKDEFGLSAHEFYEITDKVRQYNPHSGPQNRIMNHVAYKQLKKEIQQFLCSQPNPQFVLLPGNDIYLVQLYNNNGSPKVKWSIQIEIDGSLIMKVHDQLLGRGHQIWKALPQLYTSVDEVIVLLSKLKKYQVCVGNYEEHFVELGDLEKSKTAFKEGDFGASEVNHHYSSTIRTRNCELLYDVGIRCMPCQKYRGTLRSKRSRRRRATQRGTPKDLTLSKKPNVSLLDIELREKLKTLKVKHKRQARRIRTLEKQLKREISKRGESLRKRDNDDMCQMFTASEEAFTKQFSDSNSFQRIFWESQKKYNSLKKKTSMRWHPAIIKWCIFLRSKSSKGYDAMRRSGPVYLPSERCLFDYTNVMPSKLGIHKDYVQHLREEAEAKGMYDQENLWKGYVGILQDEIKIKEDLVYDRATGELVGFVDLDSCNKLFDLEYPEAKRPVAKYMLVIMVRGLTTDLKYPLAAYATPGVKADMLYPIITKAVKVVEIECDLKVLCVTCDGASPNRKYFSMHGERQPNGPPVYWTWNPYSAEERKLFFISDVPHLVKTARNCFANSFAHRWSRKLFKGGQDISWGQLIALYEQHIEPYLYVHAHKLTRAHIDLTAFSQMKVNLAAQVFSKTVANALEQHFGQRYSETVRFIKLMDEFFDCLNTRHLDEHWRKRKPYLAPYKSVNDRRFVFLVEEFLGFFDNWKQEVENRPGNYTKNERSAMLLSKQTMDGFTISVNSIVLCSKHLLENGAPFVLTHRFNQDPLEEFFSHLRHKGGGLDNPTVNDAKHSINKLRITGSNELAPLRANVKGIKEKQMPSSKSLKRRSTKRRGQYDD